MSGIQIKSMNTPDETRPFQGKGQLQLVRLGGDAICGLATFDPGWKWSANVKPIAGTKSCEASHFGYCISGRMKIAMDDGEQKEIKPGDAFMIEPGHDAWVVGNEKCVMLDVSGFSHYAESPRPSAGREERPSVH
jgi:hypothetical protein